MIVRALAALGLLQLAITTTPLTSWWTVALMGNWADPPGSTLVVLGNEVQADGTIGEVTYWRTVYAVREWREGKFERMILCGGPPQNSAADAMRQFVVSQGIDASRVLVDRTSGSTRENVIAAKQLVDRANKAPGGTDTKGQGVVLLTSDYHMFRAIRAAHKVGLQAQPRPVPDLLKRSAWYERWGAFMVLSAETCKIAYYRARGWI